MTQTKKRGNSNPDELREKYDLADLLKDAVRGKYAERYRAGTNRVLLEPEVAKASEYGSRQRSSKACS